MKYTNGLVGSEKQIKWANDIIANFNDEIIREKLLDKNNNSIYINGELDDEMKKFVSMSIEFLNECKNIISADWWIENRNSLTDFGSFLNGFDKPSNYELGIIGQIKRLGYAKFSN